MHNAKKKRRWKYKTNEMLNNIPIELCLRLRIQYLVYVTKIIPLSCKSKVVLQSVPKASIRSKT